mmetsp:Transcript_12011/g.22416  ORF Transcript_12011/g.22416 Transcript_12011/m.22416 type:complete len:241 (+) Transcript_12011:1791-2513(+)
MARMLAPATADRPRWQLARKSAVPAKIAKLQSCESSSTTNVQTHGQADVLVKRPRQLHASPLIFFCRQTCAAPSAQLQWRARQPMMPCSHWPPSWRQPVQLGSSQRETLLVCWQRPPRSPREYLKTWVQAARSNLTCHCQPLHPEGQLQRCRNLSLAVVPQLELATGAPPHRRQNLPAATPSSRRTPLLGPGQPQRKNVPKLRRPQTALRAPKTLKPALARMSWPQARNPSCPHLRPGAL